MSIIQTLTGLNRDQSAVSVMQLSNSYYGQFYFSLEERTSEKVVQIRERSEGLLHTGDWTFALKKDCIRLHRSGNEYVHKSHKEQLCHIQYGNRNYYFLNEMERWKAGFVYHMNEGRYVDLKVEDRHLRNSTTLVMREDCRSKSEIKYAFNWQERNNLGQIMSGDFINMGSIRAPFHSDLLFRIIMHKHNQAITIDSYSAEICVNEETVSPYDFRSTYAKVYNGAVAEHRFFLTDNSRYFVNNESLTLIPVSAEDSMRKAMIDKAVMNGSIDGNLVFTQGNLDRLRTECGVFVPAIKVNITHNNRRYINLTSAQANGYIRVECPHCQRNVDPNVHNMEQCEEENFRPSVLGYHSYDTALKEIPMTLKNVFRIGVEIEKECKAGAKVKWQDIHNEFGWRKERDGSLSGTIGYELVSPIYPLFGNGLIDEAKAMEAKWNGLIDSPATDACGGHIHFSRSFTSGTDLYKMIEGYIPMLYVLYPKRAKKTYSEARNIQEMVRYPKKYSAIQVLDNRLEFRIFSGVDNVKTLDWRIKLLQVFANNPSDNPVEVINTMIDKDSDLHKHLREIYTEEQIRARAGRMCDAVANWHNGYSSSDMRDLKSVILQGAN
jgi:hypothetical protein